MAAAEDARETSDELDRRADLSVDRLRRFIVPLCSHRRKRPQVLGTGVAFEAGGERMILTASHVLDEFRSDTIFVPFERDWKPLTGIGQRANTPDVTDNQDDRVDAAILLLDNASRDHWDAWSSGDDLRPNSDAQTGVHYVVAGYPHSKVKYDFRKRVVSPRLVTLMVQSAGYAAYASVGARPDANIALDYPHDQMLHRGQLQTAPSTSGMSGGAVVWAPTILDDTRQAEAGIAGIFTDWHRPPTRLLVGTRIDVHLQLILHHLPHLTKSVPAPGSVRTRLRPATA